jgi:hypothetical protein
MLLTVSVTRVMGVSEHLWNVSVFAVVHRATSQKTAILMLAAVIT